MFRKYIIFLVILSLSGMLFKALYRGYSEAYVQEMNLPIVNTFSAKFETKLNTQYKVVIALKLSEEFKKANGLIDGGDAYERSANLGRHLLEGVNIKVEGITIPDIKYKNTFSIFGGAAGYENTNLEWVSDASYLLANFEGKAGNKYKITASQKVNDSSEKRIPIPAYLMVREDNGWTHYTMYLVFLIGLLTPVAVAIFRSTLSVFKSRVASMK